MHIFVKIGGREKLSGGGRLNYLNTYLHCFPLIFGDTAAYWSKIANSYAPHPHLTPSLGVTPFEFWDGCDIRRN